MQRLVSASPRSATRAPYCLSSKKIKFRLSRAGAGGGTAAEPSLDCTCSWIGLILDCICILISRDFVELLPTPGAAEPKPPTNQIDHNARLSWRTFGARFWRTGRDCEKHFEIVAASIPPHIAILTHILKYLPPLLYITPCGMHMSHRAVYY